MGKKALKMSTAEAKLDEKVTGVTGFCTYSRYLCLIVSPKNR